MTDRYRRLAYAWLTALLVVTTAHAALAFSGGIAATVFGATGCPLCHTGGTTPSVILNGPTTVLPGDTATYTFTVFGNPSQPFAGLNVSASDGTLALGGPFSLGTRTVLGILGLVEITHQAPKQGDFLNEVEFSFQWTAPSQASNVTLRAWGNAVNHNGYASGDAAAMTTLAVSVAGSSAHTATPTIVPTPTATVVACNDDAPLHPALLNDPDAEECQAAIAKAGALYIKKNLKAVQACLRSFQESGMSGDAITECVGSATVAPTDAVTADALAKAAEKARATLSSKCAGTILTQLNACSTTEFGLEICFLADHRQAVVDAMSAEYGALAPNANADVQKCQRGAAAAAANYLLAHLKASEKCLVARNRAAINTDGAAQCVGSIVGGTFIPPQDFDTGGTVAKAEQKLQKALAAKCGAGLLAPLDACGGSESTATLCLLCTHRTAVFDLIDSEWGGTP
jgi:hypothetical protein